MTSSATAPKPAAPRADRLSAELAGREVDALLVSAPFNVRYLTGYTGSNGIALVGAGDSALRRFFTDFRYAAQSAEQVPGDFEREIVLQDELLSAAAETLSKARDAGGRLGFDDAHLSVAAARRLTSALPDGWTLVPCGGAVEALRERKDADELVRIAAAAALVDEILGWIAQRGLIGRSERSVAIELEHEMRLRGAQAPSFPSIVASGPHAALPHAEPRDVPIARGTLVTVDLGALLDGYCSDCTRTFAAGEPDGLAREVYELVLSAQLAGLEALRPGRSGREVDAQARAVIELAGYGGQFGHGLGHGVGLEVHEGPRLSRTASERPLASGNVVSVEPGVYLPGQLGVRIEDLVVLNEDGHELLSHFPKELLVVE